MHITIKNLWNILTEKDLNVNDLCSIAKSKNLKGFYPSTFSRAKKSGTGLSKKLAYECEKLLNLPQGYLYINNDIASVDKEKLNYLQKFIDRKIEDFAENLKKEIEEKLKSEIKKN